MNAFSRVVRTARKRVEEFGAFELRTPVVVEYWTDEDWSWVFCEKLDILAGGDSPAEAEIRFFMMLLQKKLACLEWSRNGSGGFGVDAQMAQKFREVL